MIGKSAFSLCKSLQYILWNAKKCNDFFNQYYSPFVYDVFDAERNNHIKSFVFGDDVEYIPAYLCYGMNNLTTLTIPENIKSIGEKAFVGCTSLSSIVWNVKNCQDCFSISPFNDSKNTISSFTFGNNVEHIPALLCSGMNSLSSIEIPHSVTSIGDYAFNDCNNLHHIYCYAPEPPIAEENVFTNYNVNLYVPCCYLDNYKYDRVFGSFRYIQCIESEDVTTDDVVVTPGTNDVTITWPTEDGADTYTIVIRKGNEVFCTLTFNADGQLLNIAFAPGRNGNHPVQYAEQAGNGYRFTVTGLEEGTRYTYNIDVKNAANKTIKSHTGEFTTESMTAVENITTNNANIQKIIRNGQLLILRDGVEYTIMGQEL